MCVPFVKDSYCYSVTVVYEALLRETLQTGSKGACLPLRLKYSSGWSPLSLREIRDVEAAWQA